ncbi:hypothetical protein Hypma_013933 [Hypsizygus marmoreus]|uniref:Uncharacterized protein n=1 Tax=Hypsizygus marmoreus TaxID=39966 RepID=A0A369KDJ3_HYPMA|nr:hypothetical protein Hypma_013933 [Hypsizygus marmoreus]
MIPSMNPPMSSRNMDMDIYWDDHRIADASLEFSPTPEPSADKVYWASTQPPQLQSIFVEVTKAKSKRQLEPETSSPWCEPVTYTPSFDFPSMKQPLARTNTTRRIGSNTVAGSTAPPMSDFDFFRQTGYARTGTSGQMDKNVGITSAKSEDGGGMKRRTWINGGSAEASTTKARRKDMSLSADPHEWYNHEKPSSKGKQKEVLQRPRHADNRLSMRSSSSSSSSSTAMSSSSLQTMNDSISMDVEIADASAMDIDATAEDHTTSAAPILPPISKNTNSLSRDRSLSSKVIMNQISSDKSTAPKPIPPAPKLHRLLTEQQPRRQRPDPVPASPVTRPPPQPKPPYVPPERKAPPAQSLSQFTRPPPLGMRRAHTVPSTTTATTSNPLPTRQKGFRPPLLSQPPSQKPQSQADVARPQHLQQQYSRMQAGPQGQGKALLADRTRPPRNVHPPPARRAAPIEEVPHTIKLFKIPSRPRLSQDEDEQENGKAAKCVERGSSPDINPEADSSFGDMSFDMDALEETMRKYD